MKSEDRNEELIISFTIEKEVLEKLWEFKYKNNCWDYNETIKKLLGIEEK